MFWLGLAPISNRRPPGRMLATLWVHDLVGSE
jgi:hypothetical protein